MPQLWLMWSWGVRSGWVVAGGLLFSIGVFASRSQTWQGRSVPSCEAGLSRRFTSGDQAAVPSKQLPANQTLSGVSGLFLEGHQPFETSLEEAFLAQKLQTGLLESYLSRIRQNEQVVVLELKGIRELTEEVFGFVDNNRFIEELQMLIHDRVRQTSSGDGVIFLDYKRMYIWYRKSRSDFLREVLQPVLEQISKYVKLWRPESAVVQSWDWFSFLSQNTRVALGPNYFYATVNRVLNYSDQIPTHVDSLEKLSRLAIQIRAKIVRRVSPLSISMPDLLLKVSQVASGKLEKSDFEEWLRRHLLLDLMDDLALYYELLKAAEIFSHPEPSKKPSELASYLVYLRQNGPFGQYSSNWNINFRSFLRNSKDARYVFVSDLKALSFTGLKMMDNWVYDGANFEKVPSLFVASSEFIASLAYEAYGEMKKELAKRGPRPSLNLHISGDDMLWAVGDLNPRQKKWLYTYLQKMRGRIWRFYLSLRTYPMALHVSPLIVVNEPGNKKSLGEAIEAAHKLMKPQP